MQSLDFTFWDVQHGNATHLKTPNGKNVIIDLGDGESPSAGQRFSPLKALYSTGVRQIDWLVITHPHRDHIDDIANISLFYVDTMFRPRWLTEADIRQGNRPQDADKIGQYLALSNLFTESLDPSRETRTPANWGGVIFRNYSDATCSRSNLNNHSCVIIAEFAGMRALISGDNEAASWQALLKQPAFKNELAGVSLFLAPHHGREAGYCIDLFQAGLNPLLTVISDDQHGETSATGKYSSHTNGWSVHRGYVGGSQEKRWCVTTRCDGTIRARFGIEDNGQKFFEVVTER